MAKLAATAAVLMAFLAVATAYHTTVTTIVNDESSSRQQGSQQIPQLCKQLISRQSEDLKHCAMYLAEEEQQMRSHIRMVGRSAWREPREDHKSECCNALENIESPCVCEAVKAALRWQQDWQEEQQEQSRGYEQEQEIQQILQKAKNLPRICKMDEPQQCQIRAFYF